MTNVIERMQKQAEQSSESNSTPRTYKPLVLNLKDGQKALFRPLVDLSGALVVDTHYKWNKGDWKQTVNAVCASAINKTCAHCQAHTDGDNKLRSSETFFLPIYLYRIACSKEVKKSDGTVLFKAGELASYKDEDDNVQLESGVRLLKLTFAYGAIATAANALLSRHSEGDNLTRRDFSLERKGGDQHSKYVLDPKDPSDFSPKDANGSRIKVSAPSAQRMLERLVEAMPPKVLETGTNSDSTGDLGDVDDFGNF